MIAVAVMPAVDIMTRIKILGQKKAPVRIAVVTNNLIY